MFYSLRINQRTQQSVTAINCVNGNNENKIIILRIYTNKSFFSKWIKRFLHYFFSRDVSVEFLLIHNVASVVRIRLFEILIGS